MEIMIYATQRLLASNIVDLYEKYRNWIDIVNQKDSADINIISTNTIQSESWWYMIITYYYK